MRQVAHLREDARGQFLIEILIALALMGIISSVFMGALYTSLQSARVADERSIALTLAQSELEFVRQQPYSANEWAYTVDTDGSSPVTGSEPDWWNDPPGLSPTDFAGYALLVTSEDTATQGIRLVSVTVRRNGQDVLRLENYETDRPRD